MRIGADDDLGTVGQFEPLICRRSRHQARKARHMLEISQDVTEGDPGLLPPIGKAEHRPALAGPKPREIRVGGDVGGQRRRDAVFAATAADATYQLANRPLRRLPIASNLFEQAQIAPRHRQREGGLQHGAPSIPARPLKKRAEACRMIQHVEDGDDHWRSPTPNPSTGPAPPANWQEPRTPPAQLRPSPPSPAGAAQVPPPPAPRHRDEPPPSSLPSTPPARRWHRRHSPNAFADRRPAAALARPRQARLARKASPWRWSHCDRSGNILWHFPLAHLTYLATADRKAD